MKRTLAIASITLLALASVCWGQSFTSNNSNACLVVAGRKHDRVDSVGQVEFRTRYSSRKLKHLAKDGVHVVMLPKHTPIDISKECGVEQVSIERELEHRDMSSLLQNALAAQIEASKRTDLRQSEIQSDIKQAARRCVEFQTNMRGEQSCVLWNDDPKLADRK